MRGHAARPKGSLPHRSGSGPGTGLCGLGCLKWRLLCFTETVGFCQVNPAHLFFSKMGDVGRNF